ncbi:MAG: UPF0175 family protein [Thermodesulfobacteriota bacterium]|nr:UPF0175 family protein [Thermodesulfobacteriota bacterium]
MQVLIDVPEELIYAIKLPPKEIPTRLKRELAVRLYIKGLLNFGKVGAETEIKSWRETMKLAASRHWIQFQNLSWREAGLC